MKPKSYLWKETKYMPTFLNTSSVSAVLALPIDTACPPHAQLFKFLITALKENKR